MIEAFEVKSIEEALDHAEKVEYGESSKESSRADNAISTRSHDAVARSFGGRMRRVLLFAVPICLLGAAVIIGMANSQLGEKQTENVNDSLQTTLSGRKKETIENNEREDEDVQGPYFEKLTTYQSLTGEHAGGIEDVFLQATETYGAEIETWPIVIPYNKTFLWWSRAHDMKGISYDFPDEHQVKSLASHSTVFFVTERLRPKCVRFPQEAMRVLLGSLHGTLPGAPGPAPKGPWTQTRTWTGLAASVFGAWFGGPAVPAVPATRAWRRRSIRAPWRRAVIRRGTTHHLPMTQAAPAQATAAEAGTAAGWLASELLEGRAMNKLEPLVLDAKGQQAVAQMDPAKRSQFLSTLAPGGEGDAEVLSAYPIIVEAPGGEGDAEVLSAYPIIVELFLLVQELTKGRVTTVLDVGEVFSGQEFAQLQEENFDSATKLRDAAVAADGGDLTAEARRSGPRFLLRCLLLLEKRNVGSWPEEKEAAAEFLREKIPETLKTPLLPDLKGSKLNIWRGGPTEFDGILFKDVLEGTHLGKKFNRVTFLEIIEAHVATERRQQLRERQKDARRAMMSAVSLLPAEILGDEG